MSLSTEVVSPAIEAIIAANDPVVSVDWLHANLKDPNIKVLDTSWYIPYEQRNPIEEYKVAHIPGALFFDIEGIADLTSELPHMLPSKEALSAAASALGITNQDALVVYDGKGLYSAARVWWMFRLFGHDKIWVLDGGFPRWHASGFDVESGDSKHALLKSNAANDAVKKVHQGVEVIQKTFLAKPLPDLVWSMGQIQQNMENKKYQHVDARSRDRFDGVAPEPRKGIKSGHIPGSKCIPYTEILDSSHLLLPSNELAKRFEVDVSLDQPIVLSCGTGVTACIIALGLHRLGKYNIPVYDGSWTEWALEHDLTD